MVILAKFGQNPSKYVAAVAILRVARRRKKERTVRQDLHVTKLRVGKELDLETDLNLHVHVHVHVHHDQK